MKVCDIKDCGKPYHGGGLCKPHYNAKWWSSVHPRKTNPWTKEARALVAGMLLEKLSASQIVARLAPDIQVSRNAVVGIVHRDAALRKIGLHGGRGAIPKQKSRVPGVLAKPKPPRLVKPYRHPRTPAPAWLPPKQFIHELGDCEPDRESMFMYAPKLPKRLPVPFTAAFECRSIPLMELKRGECKWAVNDAPPKGTHLFCGNQAEPDKPYCAGHSMLSYKARPPLPATRICT